MLINFTKSNISAPAVLVANRHDMRYLTGFCGEGLCVATPQKNFIITDFRYVEQAQIESPGCDVLTMPQSGAEPTLLDLLGKLGASSIAFDGADITFERYESFKNALKNISMVAVSGVVRDMRMVKSAAEIEKIRHAEAIGDRAFAHILGYIRPGVRECDIALEIEYFLKKNGAQKLSFDTIVASGVRGSLCHAMPTDKAVCAGELVTLDFGCICDGYCSDMTRTVAVGKVSDELVRMYNTVLEAQLAALSQIKAGVTGVAMHKVAADIINSAGYEGRFDHGLGHGLGLEVHEQPRLSPRGTHTLEVGHVVSVEPGIYVPGVGGVRIEDLVAVTANGVDNFTASPKELIVL